MKKIYRRPQIKICNLMSGGILFNADSDGYLGPNEIGARRDNSFDDEDEEEITKSVWFDD